MRKWFEEFTDGLTSEQSQEDLIPAGIASTSEAVAHYRYQHHVKIRDVVEEALPKLKNNLGDSWSLHWEAFIAGGYRSPRSLDYFPDVFLEYLQKTNLSSDLKSLAQFERLLETYCWETPPLTPVSLSQLNAESCLELGAYRIVEFEASVIHLYQEWKGEAEQLSKNVLFWALEDGTHFRVMEDWEVDALSLLPQGVGQALVSAPDDEEAVAQFFNWLGRSCLIRNIRLS